MTTPYPGAPPGPGPAFLRPCKPAWSKQRLKSLVGTVQQVLVEGPSPESEYLLSGRLVSQAPDIDGQVYITAGLGQVGEVQPVRLTRALPYDLVGELVD